MLLGRVLGESSFEASHWLDYARPEFGERVEEAKTIFSIMRVFVAMPAFWALFDQHSSRWVFQASRMNRQVGSYEFTPDQVRRRCAPCACPASTDARLRSPFSTRFSS